MPQSRTEVECQVTVGLTVAARPLSNQAQNEFTAAVGEVFGCEPASIPSVQWHDGCHAVISMVLTGSSLDECVTTVEAPIRHHAVRAAHLVAAHQVAVMIIDARPLAARAVCG